MIKLSNIKKSYNNQLVVNVDTFIIEDGKKYVITGLNGSGKSTFAKMISCVIPNDKNVWMRIKREKDEIGRPKYLQIGYLPQKAYIFDTTLEKNIAIGYNKENDESLLHLEPGERYAKKTHIYKKVNELIEALKLSYLRGKNAKGFSGGEQQKVALARFLMQDFDVYVFDEPTSAMDTHSVLLAEKVISEYTHGKSIVMITHEKDQAKRFSDKIYVMNNGKLV